LAGRVAESGRRRSTGNAVQPQGCLGFKSQPVRQAARRKRRLGRPLSRRNMTILPSRVCIAALIALAPLVNAVPVAAQPLPGTTCTLFPSDTILNTDVSTLPVNAKSEAWKGNMAQNAYLHPDLGTFAQWYGMPVNVAPPPSSGLTPTFNYNSESDHPAEGYPIDQSTLIEGGPAAGSGTDRHALIVNKSLCKLYEIYNLQNFTNGQQPTAG